MSLFISIIIPAFNAAHTIGFTLDSILAQTNANWEVIVVNDGSKDETVEIVKRYIKRDHRIVLISQSNQGTAAARNAGIETAQFEWIHLIDADDWVSTVFLERMINVLETNPMLDAVHCGWNLVAPDETLMGEKFAVADPDLFPSFVRTCAFVVHSCLFRKSLIASAGIFDASFINCQDWDFWQRIARIGACFGSLREAHVFYRMRPGSQSKNVKLSLTNSLKIIRQGFIADPRVLNVKEEYKYGLKSANLSAHQLYCFTWFAGLWIGQGGDTSELFKMLDDDCNSNLDPEIIGSYIFEAVCFSTSSSQSEWLYLWQKNKESISNFFALMEAKSKTPSLKINSLNVLTSLIAAHI